VGGGGGGVVGGGGGEGGGGGGDVAFSMFLWGAWENNNPPRCLGGRVVIRNEPVTNRKSRL